ncbi:hypothetical protein REPUB_Repub01dG0028500 [Reevesia pubescens]
MDLKYFETSYLLTKSPRMVIFYHSLIYWTDSLLMLTYWQVPIIMDNESEQARAWSQIHCEDTLKQSIPVIKLCLWSPLWSVFSACGICSDWQLNERMYGELQGFNKQETTNRFGKEKVHKWRRSYDIPPPNGKSLEMCAQRAVAYFKDNVTFISGFIYYLMILLFYHFVNL